MSGNVLTELLVKFGGPALAGAISAEFGQPAGKLAAAALDALGKAFGVAPEPETIRAKIETVAAEAPDKAQSGVLWAESQVAPVLLAEAQVWKEAAAQQEATNQLLMADQQQGGPAAAWRWIWQYVLMVLWAWSLVVVHILNAAIRIGTLVAAPASTPEQLAALGIPAPDLVTLLALTASYQALYMGGHTVLRLFEKKLNGGESAQ